MGALAGALGSAGVRKFGLHLDSGDGLADLIGAAGEGLAALVVPPSAVASESLVEARARGMRVYCEVTGWSEEFSAIEPAVDGFILKGHECGGLVGEQTTFILLQEFRRRTTRPFLARGGITPETAAAAHVAGASGVVLDDQVLLLAELSFDDPALRKWITSLSGAETTLIDDPEGGRYLRGLDGPGNRTMAEFADRIRTQDESLEAVAARLSCRTGVAMSAGQTIGLAAPIARRYRTLGRLVTAIRKAVRTLPARAAKRRALAPNGALAESIGTVYPILQGPMTRVSDVAPFIAKVAEDGALPFAALALLRGQQVETLLGEIRDALGERPWGVGLLGFAHTDILREQMAAVEKYRPKFAIIAGARVNQVLASEAKGIRTFVHASTPGILTHYLEEGVRRFIVEGRECGGHIGPLTSFVLWSSMVEVLRDHPIVARTGASVELVFAGGIHDPVSAAMVATIAEPLAARGVKIGVLMGTAYLFTREIVESGAIVPDYQEVAIACGETLSLSEGGGFASRCAITPIASDFRARKHALEAAGATPREVRERMETYSLGRLRMATKGVARTGPGKPLLEIDPEQRRAEGMYMIGQAAALHHRTVGIAELHESVTTASIDHLSAVDADEAEIAAYSGPAPADIAIVGIATLLPGADTPEAFWRRLVSGESAIRSIPEDRWSLISHYSEDRSERDKVYARRGGFIGDVAFNPLNYGIPPASLASIDPMQLLALELVSDVLADADVRPEDDVDRSRISVVFGFSGGMGELGLRYAVRSELPRLVGQPSEEILAKLPEWTEDSFAGILPNVSAGRVANRFDFGGTNQTVDAACASSLAAVYSAVLELESGRADMVIAGGVDTLQAPFGYLCFSKTQALSPRGVCNTFDTSADGIVISEGLAAVALKRLADAERDGDRVYAVIKGVGTSSDGRAKGLTAPLPTGQKRALRRAYQQAGFNPATVQLFEAHGTGTVAGDRAELETVTGVLEAEGASPRSAAIGSVKTLIGHTKAAAGVAGLMKAALGLHHRVLPPHALVQSPNAALQKGDSPLYLSQLPRPWTRAPGLPRRAGVSAFGFGGTNFHVALEEYDGGGSVRAAVDIGRDIAPLAFAAESRTALAARLRDLVHGLAEGRFSSLREMASHALSSPNKGSVRLGFTALSLDQARVQIEAALRLLEDPGSPPPKDIHFTQKPVLSCGGKLAFLFPGQGSQYPDMLREAALLGTSITDALDRAEEVLAATPTFGGTGRRLARMIYPGDAFSPAERKAQMAALMATEIAQPALGAVETGLVRLLAELGLAPDMVVGQSYGEFVALHAAGVYGFEDLMRLSEARGRAMIECADPDTPGAMAAVLADAEVTRATIAGIDGVVIANLNSPKQTVIAGPRAAIEQASAAIAGAGVEVHSVPVSQAFHSPLMAPARARFEEALAAVDWHVPAIPVYSNTLGAAHPADPQAIRTVMADHLTRPCDYISMIRAMAADGAGVYLEVGPKSVLSGRLREILGETDAVSIALDRSPSDATSLFDGLVRLFVEGAPIDLSRFVGRLANVVPRPVRGDPASVWLVNGAYARRSDAPKRDVTPPVPGRTVSANGASPPAPVGAPAPAYNGHYASVPVVFNKEELEFMPVTNEDLNWSKDVAQESQDVLCEYHRMMKEFLRVQESVMLAYMGREITGQRRIPLAYAPSAELALHSGAAPPPPVQSVAPMPAPERRPEPARTNGSAPTNGASTAPAPEPHPEHSGANGATPTNGGGAATTATHTSKPAPTAEPVDLLSTFTSIIADKTGYPPDALDPEQDLEAELGIDSIKRMEILGAFQKVLPEAIAETMRSEMDAIAELSTIRQIVDFVSGKQEGAPPSAKPNGAAEEIARPFDLTGEANERAAVLPRFLQVPFEEPIDHLDLAPPEGRRFVVTEAADGFHEDMAAALAEGGASTVILPRAVLDSEEPGAIADWVASIGAESPPSGLVYLDGRASLPDLDAVRFAGWRAMHRRGVKRLFVLLRALAPFLRDGGRFIAATESGGLFGRALDRSGQGVSAVAGAIGIVRAISLEWPECGSKVIDLDPGESAADRARRILAELSLERGRREVGYPGGRRTIFRTEPHSLSPPDHLPAIGPDWVVVATGGARGITAECLRTVAPYRPTLILLGRSPLPEPEPEASRDLDVAGLRLHYLEAARAAGKAVRPKAIEAQIQRLLGARDLRRNLDDFAAMGARVDYRSVDVCDPEAIATLFDDVYEQYGRVDMVVHGAGLIEDAFIEKKSPESFERVFDTKVDSAFLIALALRPETLKALCFFTSVAGRYGNPGQIDYAAANETLNRLAWELKRRFGDPVTVKAINWGPWAETTTGAGMVTPDVRRQFESRGIHMVEALPGRDLFFKEMFWADPAEVETVAWVADGEHMEEKRCALPILPGSESLGDRFILLRNARKRENGHRELVWRFDLVSAPYVDHHRFDGFGVLPFAAVLQMLAEVPVAFGIDKPVIACEDVRMFRGLTLRDGPRNIRFVVEEAGEGSGLQVSIFSGDDARRPYYRAMVRFGDSLPSSELRAPDPAGRWDGPEIETVYRRWLSHGPRFQTLTGIRSIDRSGIRAMAVASRPEDFVPTAAARQWSYDVGLIDGALQTVWVWTRAIQQTTTLPLRVAEVRRFAGDTSNGPFLIDSHILSAPGDTNVEVTIRIFDASGALCMELERFCCQASAELNRLGGDWQGGERPIQDAGRHVA